jgi:hypothetical protein
LLYLVPFCVGSSFLTAVVRGELPALLAYTEEIPEEVNDATDDNKTKATGDKAATSDTTTGEEHNANKAGNDDDDDSNKKNKKAKAASNSSTKPAIKNNTTTTATTKKAVQPAAKNAKTKTK